MANRVRTIFQGMEKAIGNGWSTDSPSLRPQISKHVNSYDMSKGTPIYTAKNKEEYKKKKLELQQQKYLANMWKKTNYDLTNQQIAGLSQVQIMYRDVELMDAFPEIGAALDIYADESCVSNDKGTIVNVISNSSRIKSVIEDLLVNRLDIQVTSAMVIRAMCKYGNEFMMLNVDSQNGVIGWKQLPVMEMQRNENGITNPYSAYQVTNQPNASQNPEEITFSWNGSSDIQNFRNWQIAHFRLITDGQFLPYGVSILHKARRHFRMLSMMEDMMLIYRLDKSIERRVYKIYVGAIDDKDVPAYVEEIANEFKRTPIVDPQTGQVDLRKNILPVWRKTPIPLLDGRTITIENLAKEFKEGKINYVYSVQDKTHAIVPGKVVWCGKNYDADKMVKVTLDDGGYVCLAPEHEFIMRDGTKKRADEIKIGESVMPYYIKVDKNSDKRMERYEKIFNPNSAKFEYTHRLIASELNKGDDKFNTVHHKDFNKYNNTPENLLWCDFYEHKKMHSERAIKMWKNPSIREQIKEKLSENRKEYYKENPMLEETKEKISVSLKKRYKGHELDFVRENSRKTMIAYNKSTEHIQKAYEMGKANGYKKVFEEYNHSELHNKHDEIRRKATSESWVGFGRTNRIQKMNIRFDETIWNRLMQGILDKKIINRKTMLEYINKNLIDYLISINCNKRLEKNHFISREVLENRIKEKGFDSITDYINSNKKNHKVSNIEYIGGDDVYCMTVQGLNGEEDRHNFAVKSIINDNEWGDNGCFVSNCVDNDIFIPVRDQAAPTPIDTLAAGQNLTSIDDIKYIQNKVLAALRIPKTFLNFENEVGNGNNLSLLDVRFARVINRIQQAFLMELTKVVTIHLYLLGFKDDLTNFTLTMNNPSTQAEQLDLENTQKKVAVMRDAVSDPGGGIPIMSMTRAWRDILHWSDDDIKNEWQELRIENALANELKKTSQIIQRTHIFDPTDNTYGEPDAQYAEAGGDGGMDGGPGGGGGPMGGGGFGGGLDDLGGPGDEGAEGDLSGEEGEMPPEEAGGADAQQPEMGPPPSNENTGKNKKNIILESTIDGLIEEIDNGKKNKTKRIKPYNQDKLFINESYDDILKELGKFTKEEKNSEKKNLFD
jgi:hypothetical protein